MKQNLLFLLLTMLVVVVVSGGTVSNGQKVSTGESGSADEQAEIELLKKMENERIQAGVRKDVEAIVPFTAEEYVQIDFDGRVMDKAATFQRIRSSDIRLQSNAIEDLTVRLYGDVAVVTGRASPKGVADGREFLDPIRYSRVYVKRDGRWQVVLFQQTRIAKAK
jgi:ketosteroid isomerase-like protein